jgi:hypothetical protein
MTEENLGIQSYKNSDEMSSEDELTHYLRTAPMPEGQILENLGLFMTSKNLSRLLFMHHIYEMILPVPGVVMDFGTRWGQNLAMFSAVRGIYEPFNRHRKLIGFDTFSGFPSVVSQDGSSSLMRENNVSVTDNYETYLDGLMKVHEALNPISHIKKYEIIAGDATKTVPQYLIDNPHTIIALAYFDFDIYEPTKVCLEAIRDRLVKGSVLGFDELNDHDSPGETIALMETFGLNNVKLRRWPHVSRTAYFVVE